MKDNWNEMIEWLAKNRELLFFGLSVVILLWFVGKIFKKKESTSIQQNLDSNIDFEPNQKELQNNNQSINAGNDTINVQAGRDINLFEVIYPVDLIDQRIQDEVISLRKSRFFTEFDHIKVALSLGKRLTEGNLKGGNDETRCKALAWCARLLAYSDENNRAKEFLNKAKDKGDCLEIKIAEAFIASQNGNKERALQILAPIDTPLSRTAALFVVAHHDGSDGAFQWLNLTKTEISALDGDGKFFILDQNLTQGRWEHAEEFITKLRDQDLDDAPALNHLFAVTHLLNAIPVEFRSLVIGPVPFNAASFPLADDASAMIARKRGRLKFIDSATVARQLNLQESADLADDYALWLELRDPELSSSGRQNLEKRLSNLKSALRLVPLALQFGINLDLQTVEKEIERQVVLHGGITKETAIARFAIVFTKTTPQDVSSYLSRHYDDLSKFVDKKFLAILRIEALSKAGLGEKANECFKQLLKEGLPEAEKVRIQKILAGVESEDSIELLQAQFKLSNSLIDLEALVGELERRKKWDDVCEYGKVLFQKTRSLRDAEHLARSLSNSQRTEELVEIFSKLPDFRKQSIELQIYYCWALYSEGDILECRRELIKFDNEPDDRNYRALQVNLGIALGDWNALSAYVAAEYQARDKRSAHDLIFAAGLAHQLGVPQAKDLTRAAVIKGNDDAIVLAKAYFMATTSGWEDTQEVSLWLQKAAELSGSEGPLQKVTLKDLADMKPEWDQRESEIWQRLSRGEVPLFLAGKSLHKSLIDLILFPSLANLSEQDVRRRHLIPAYNGKRQPVEIDIGKMTFGIDPTSLLTLSFLNILDKVLEALGTVFITHSTMAWLFTENKEVAFHQPSRIRDAHSIRNCLATNCLEKFVSTCVLDAELASQIGNDLAMLITEAERKNIDESTQHIVIRPSPVHRLGSLMSEEADLTKHTAVISSCIAVVRKLRQIGQITEFEEMSASAYLQIHEESWSHQPEIKDGAVLYLDDLATDYFVHLGILTKLKTAGFKAVITPTKISETNALISYDSIVDKVREHIEQIRSNISSRIELGKIKVARQHKLDKLNEHSIAEHPTVGLFDFPEICDGIIVDDRFFNQNLNFEKSGVLTPIYSTLEVIDAMVSAGSISATESQQYRTMLRRAGFFFISVSDNELSHYLKCSPVNNGKVLESAELKAVRENILRVRMSSCLQLPAEVYWLNSIQKTFAEVLKNLWETGADIPKIIIFSDWLIEQIDIRGWAHSLGTESGENIVKTGRAIHIMRMLSPNFEAPQEVKEAYWKWLENKVLVPLNEQFPDLYSLIVKWQMEQISEIVETNLAERFSS